VDIIVDASVIIAVLANESERDRLIRVTTGVDLLAPASVHWEIGNAFSAMLKRGRATLQQVLTAIDSYRLIPVRFVDIELDEALRIAKELDIYAYDAYLIQCAVKYDAPLLTLDQGLAQAARAMEVDIVEVGP